MESGHILTMGSVINLIGQRFGRLLVVSQTDKRNPTGSVYWQCRCDCGKLLSVDGRSLRAGKQKSCGCLQREYIHKQHNNLIHGGCHVDRLYNVWHGMKDRCYYPGHNRYQHYGGRGITVCEEWRNNYAAFRDWAMSHGYDPDAPRGGCTIDRIDVDGNYEPDNCRWVDAKTQAKNQRRSKSHDEKQVSA